MISEQTVWEGNCLPKAGWIYPAGLVQYLVVIYLCLCDAHTALAASENPWTCLHSGIIPGSERRDFSLLLLLKAPAPDHADSLAMRQDSYLSGCSQCHNSPPELQSFLCCSEFTSGTVRTQMDGLSLKQLSGSK